MSEPRNANCQAYHMSAANLITGVELKVFTMPSTAYELRSVKLVDEAANGVGGPTVASTSIYDAEGLPVFENIWLAWPFDGSTPAFTDHLLPGNPQRQHFISNKYAPPQLGPLMLFLADNAGNVISDVCAGFGLPLGHHVSFELAFKARGAVADPDVPGTIDNATLLRLVVATERVATAFERLLTHLEIP